MNELTKQQVIKTILKKTGAGLPDAIKIYNTLSANGFYQITRSELNKYIKENY